MNRDHAIVVGGGFAGLTAARVLSDHFATVTVLEKDDRIGSVLPRTGAAQGHHLHVLLKRGQELLELLYPGIESRFKECPWIDWAEDTKWEFIQGTFPRYSSGICTRSFSRPFLESTIHSLVSQIPNIQFKKAQVESVFIKNGLVDHLKCIDQSTFSANVFVFAGGQNFPIERLIPTDDWEKHSRSFPIHITYRSVILKNDSLSFDHFKQYYYQFYPPNDKLGGVICPIENNRSIATVIEYGIHRNGKPTFDEFKNMAANVPGGTFVKILKNAVPLSDVSVFYKPSMFIRRPDRIVDFPENAFLIGDLACSLNPVFGQGMSMALGQAFILQRIIESENIHSRHYHRNIAKLSRLPFLLSRLGSNTEKGFTRTYLRRFLTRCLESKRLHRKFLSVLHQKASYPSLLDFNALIVSLLPQRGTYD